MFCKHYVTVIVKETGEELYILIHTLLVLPACIYLLYILSQVQLHAHVMLSYMYIPA